MRYMFLRRTTNISEESTAWILGTNLNNSYLNCQLHGVSNQNATILIFTAVRTSHLTVWNKTHDKVIQLNYSVFWVITRGKVVWNRRFGTTYSVPSCPLKMGPIDSPKTSVLNHLTPHDNPEDGRIQFDRGGSLRSREVIQHCVRLKCAVEHEI